MQNIITIEYSAADEDRARAIALARSILQEHEGQIEELKLLPLSSDLFEVFLNDRLIFSKKNLGRCPNKYEIELMLRQALGNNEDFIL